MYGVIYKILTAEAAEIPIVISKITLHATVK